MNSMSLWGLLSMAAAATALASPPAAISVVSGNHQFLAGIAYPATAYQPLKVKVTDGDGGPVPGEAVRFTVSSPRGDVVFEGGPEYFVTTDTGGNAVLSGMKGLSGDGFFNVTANVSPALPNPAVFLMSQYAHATCGVPVLQGQTESVIESSSNPAAVGSSIEVSATVRLANDSGPVYFGDVAIVDTDRLVASEAIANAVPSRVRVTLALPAGAYLLRARLLETCSYRTSVSAPLVQGVTSGLRPSVDYSDMWWKATESGWGMSVIQHASGQLFVVWYHYREDGSPQWLVIPGGVWTSTTSFTGAMYRTSGPAYTGVFDPSRVSVVPVGVATLAFSASDRGTFSWSMDGVQGFRSFTRQPF